MPPSHLTTQTAAPPPASPEPLIQADVLRLVLNNSADGIVVADTSGKFILFNPAAEQILGIGLTDTQPDEWSSRYGCFMLDGVTPVPPQDVPLVRAIRGERVDDYELIIRNSARPEGIYLSCNARPLRDGNGQLSGGVVAFRDITERKKAEAQIRNLNAQLERYARDQETRYRLAAKATRDAIWDWDLRTNLIEWNEGLEILFGYPFEAKNGTIEWWSSHVHPDDRNRAVRGLYAAIAGGQNTWTAEYRFQCRDGKYAIVVDRGYVVRDETGRPVRMVGAMLDMTERKHSEAALAHSLALLEATLDSTADGILVVDEEGRIVSFNRKFVEIWRLPEEALVSRDDNVTIAAAMGLVKDPESWLSKIRELYAKPDVTSLDTFELVDGRVIERYSQTRRLGAESTGRVWSFRDVTERHRAQQRLKEEQEFLQAILENCGECIVAADAEGHMTLINRAMRELYKLPPDFMPATTWREYPVYRADGVTRLAPDELPLSRALRGEQIRNAEIVTIGDDGKQTKLLVSGNSIIQADGHSSGAVLVMHDVTEHERLQRQLLQSQKMESIGTLAGGIAHDFNNLLAVIMGQGSLMLRDKSLSPKVRDSLKAIIEAAERGSSLTHQLLAYARGGLQQFGASDLNGLVDGVLQLLRRTTPPQIDLIADLEPNLPAILADPTQIEQVVMNLCLNAVEASQSPGRLEIRTSRVELDAAAGAKLELAPGFYARLEVQDRGSGMESAVADRIFEPFFSTKFTGRGMGLAATLGIVNSHHGQIRAKSQPGQGTLMTVWLPLADQNVPVRPRLGSTRRAAVTGGSETILVIDDDPAVSRTVVQILSSLGYCVIAHNERKAASAFLDTNAEDVDLIILDLNVARTSSEPLFREVNSRCKGAPILVASGGDEPEIRQSARSWGAAGFVHKPFLMSELAQTVRHALDDRPAPAERS
jgi:two-component system cell cycle sensor histidine kinase/response regulator CckA